MRSWLNHARKVKWLTVNHTHLETRKPRRLKNGNLPYRCRFTIFPLGFNFPTILIHFFYQVKSWQNRCSSECENWMSEMFPGANSIEALMILNEDKTWTMDKKKKKLTSYQIQMQSPLSPLLNCWVFRSSKIAPAWIRTDLDTPVRRATLPYGVEFEKLGNLKFENQRREMAITIGWRTQKTPSKESVKLPWWTILDIEHCFSHSVCVRWCVESFYERHIVFQGFRHIPYS